MKQSSGMKKTAMKKTDKPAALPFPSDFISHASGALDEGIHQLNQCIRDRSETLERCLRDVESLATSSPTFLNTLIAELGPFEYNTRIVSIISRLMEFSDGLKHWDAECTAAIRRAHDTKFKQKEYTTSNGFTKPAPPAIRLDLSKSHQQQAEAIIESYMVDGHVEGVSVLPDYDYRFLLSYGYTLYAESIAGYINAILRNEFRSDGDVWTRARKLSKKLNLPPPVVTSDATFTLKEDDGFDDAHASADAPSVPATYDGEAIDRLFQGKETSNQAGSFYRERTVASKACEEAADAQRFITCRAGPDGRLSNESFEFLQSMVKVNSGNRSAIFCNELSYQLSLYRKEGLLWFPIRKCPPKDATNEASASAVILGESPGK